MKCQKCSKKAEIKLYKKNLCKFCFVKLIDKRIRKDARLNKYFKKNDRLLIIGKLAKKVVDNITKSLPCEKTYASKLPSSTNRFNKIVIETTMDDEVHDFLSSFIRPKYKQAKKSKFIKIFRIITDKELAIYAKLNNITFKAKKRNKNIQKMLEDLEKHYPQTRFSIYNSLKELRCE